MMLSVHFFFDHEDQNMELSIRGHVNDVYDLQRAARTQRTWPWNQCLEKDLTMSLK